MTRLNYLQRNISMKDLFLKEETYIIVDFREGHRGDYAPVDKNLTFEFYLVISDSTIQYVYRLLNDGKLREIEGANFEARGFPLFSEHFPYHNYSQVSSYEELIAILL